MTSLVTIYGGSGFVGRYVAQRMARAGWRVRVAVRRPNEALFVRQYGAVGQVEPVLCNIRDDASVRAAMDGADAVVNCVGTFDWRGKNNFDAVQHDGAERVARIAAEEGVGRLVHISSLMAGRGNDSAYARTKEAGEAAVSEAFPNAVILRPSVIFGIEDSFFNRFAGMARLAPVIPITGGKTLFQPVFVDDVAAAVEKGVTGEAAPGIYELGGPDVASFSEILREMLGIIQRKRGVLNMPFWLAHAMAFCFDMLQTATGGLIRSPLSRDQVTGLKTDVVVAEGAAGFDALGITPKAMESVLPAYLFRYRPSGQFAAITGSARNLRT